MRIPRAAAEHAPACVRMVNVKRMSRAFGTYHLTDEPVLNRSKREQPHADSLAPRSCETRLHHRRRGPRDWVAVGRRVNQSVV